MFDSLGKLRLARLKAKHNKSENEIIEHFFGANFKDLQGELLDNIDFITELNQKFASEHITLFGGGQDWHYLLYALIRCKKPDIVVETGVSHGLSSTIILKALDVNCKGFLYSIDLPNIVEDNEFILPNGKDTGWIIPEQLRKRDLLIIGDAKKELPLIFQKIGKTDIFLHDSCHTIEHETFELNLSYLHMNKSGFVLCHDAFDNKVFYKFCKKNNLEYNNYYNFGIAKIGDK
jgi:hypothetical protein